MQRQAFPTWVLLLLGTSCPSLSPAAPGGSGAATKANLDLPFSATGESDDEEEAPEIILFYGQQYEGDGIFFSCDRSGSMREGNKWQRLQGEVIKNISTFSERVQFGLVFFAGDVVKFPASGRPAQATPAMKSAAIAMVKSTTFAHGTCTKPALLACLVFANASSSKRKVIIHLSDGLHWCAGYDPAQYGKETLAAVKQHNPGDVQINSICIGPPGEADEVWMRKLAEENHGSYTRIYQ